MLVCVCVWEGEGYFREPGVGWRVFLCVCVRVWLWLSGEWDKERWGAVDSRAGGTVDMSLGAQTGSSECRTSAGSMA